MIASELVMYGFSKLIVFGERAETVLGTMCVALIGVRPSRRLNHHNAAGQN